jgi:hypothetical protein
MSGVHVLTLCTNRKHGTVDASLRARRLRSGTNDAVSADWKERRSKSNAEIKAYDRYKGRGFAEAKRATAALAAEMWVVSAGLGLVRAERKVPAYSLTITGNSEDCISRKVRHFSSASWWAAINTSKRPIRGLVRSKKPELLIVNVSKPYIGMIGDDLLSLSEEEMTHLRIIGPRPTAVPEQLRPYLLPYDERLEAIRGYKGTRSDFPQRALRHFMTEILAKAPKARAKKHAALVASQLSAYVAPKTPKRPRQTDEQIRRLIVKNWKKVDGRAGRMLHYLRHTEIVACEQSRFSQLFWSVADNKRAQ